MKVGASDADGNTGFLFCSKFNYVWLEFLYTFIFSRSCEKSVSGFSIVKYIYGPNWLHIL